MSYMHYLALLDIKAHAPLVCPSCEFIQGSLQPDSVLWAPDWLGNFRIICTLADNFYADPELAVFPNAILDPGFTD